MNIRTLLALAGFVLLVVIYSTLYTTGCGGSSGGGTTFTGTTAAEIRSAIAENNSYGIVAGLTLGEITLPACSSSDTSAAITYSITDLPSWLSFDTTTRGLTLASGRETVPTDALTASTVTYTCTQGSNSASVELVINDLDGGGVIDSDEYEFGEVPLINLSGYFALTPGNLSTYRVEYSSFKDPNGLTKVSAGMDPLNAEDDTSDFDGDAGITGGGSNPDEITNGSNLFVYVSSGAFGAKADYSTGSVPQTVETADLNNDGYLDLVTTNSGSGAGTSTDISVLLGSGDGTFGDETRYTTGEGPYYVAPADFNTDGYTDLAVSNFGMASGGTTLTILINDGDGTFTASSESPATGTAPSGIIAADFNGDEIIDLAVANTMSNNLSVFTGDGDGTFTASSESPVTGTGPYCISAADFNGDGDIDLAVANSGTDNLTILLGDGDATFTASGETPDAGDFPVEITAADFDSDGNIDLAVPAYSGNVLSIIPGDGDGTFGTPQTKNTGTKPGGVAAADFDGDGDVDLIVAINNSNAGTTAEVFLNEGDGTFTDGTSYTTGEGPFGVAAGDFNGDGKIDFATANATDNTTSILLNE